jgi:hypothetical protein
LKSREALGRARKTPVENHFFQRARDDFIDDCVDVETDLTKSPHTFRSCALQRGLSRLVGNLAKHGEITGSGSTCFRDESRDIAPAFQRGFRSERKYSRSNRIKTFLPRKVGKTRKKSSRSGPCLEDDKGLCFSPTPHGEGRKLRRRVMGSTFDGAGDHAAREEGEHVQSG